MEFLQRTRSIEDERSVIVQLTEKEETKEQAKPIPEKLIKILLTENIDVSDVIKLKEMLNDWITLLTDNNKTKE
jgi:DNA-binding MarR family transcriptional regulator